MGRAAMGLWLVMLALVLSGCGGMPDGARSTKPRQPAPIQSGPQAPQGSTESKDVQGQTESRPGPLGGDPKKLSGTFRPYVIQGKTYFPMITANGYSEQGIASWYGDPFHGRATSCGETYDMFQMTAAHKLLPMQTMVRVTNLENGRSLVVRVNDRGPFVAGRIIDLSYAAALQLGSANKGTAQVLVETLGGVPGASDGNLPGLFYVQIGAFQVKDNAEALVAKIRSQGYGQSRVQYAEVGGEKFWRVQAGTFNGLAMAKEAHGRLLRLYPSAFILAD